MHLAAAPATGIQVGAIFGTIGTGGISAVLTLLLILGVRGKGELKLSRFSAFTVGFVAGTFYAAAGTFFWAAAGTVSTSATQSLTANTSLGQIGPGAVALGVVVCMYAGKPSPGFAAVLGIASATIFGIAGHAWAIPATLVTGPIASMLGVTL